MKNIAYLILSGLLLMITGCEKDPEPANFAPQLTTSESSGVFRTGATLSGEIVKADGVVVKEYGILYSTLQSMAEYEMKAADNDNNGKFSVQLTELEAGQTYYYCAYAASGYSIAKGEIKKFITVPSEVPVFSTLQIDHVNEKSFVANTSILDEGGSSLVLKGFCWKETANNSDEPKMTDASKNLESFDDFEWRVNDLKPGRQYAVRAFAINGNGLGYGATTYVFTAATNLPVVSSCQASDSTQNSIKMLARILANASSVTEKGFCYSSDNELPTVTDMREISTIPDTVIYGTVGGLTPGNTYYIRAYATSSLGTGYGDVFSYTIPGGNTGPGIYSADDLMAFRDAVNTGADLSNWRNSSGIININANIDMAGKESWQPIKKLDYILEGNGHTISNLKIYYSELHEKPAATTGWVLIGFVNQNYGVIRNLTMGEGCELKMTPDDSSFDIGGETLAFGMFCGSLWNNASVTNCNNHAYVKVCPGAGFVGIMYGGAVESCTNHGNIVTVGSEIASGSSRDTSISGIAYICGNSQSNIQGRIANCMNYGIINGGGASSSYRSAGICSRHEYGGSIINCGNYGKVIAGAGLSGGISARVSGGNSLLENCVNEGEVLSDNIAGGIVGEADIYRETFSLLHCKNGGNVTSANVAGGICGLVRKTDGTLLMENYTNGGIINGTAGNATNVIGKDERSVSN